MVTIGRIKEAVERYDFLVRLFSPGEEFVREYNNRIARLGEVICREYHLSPDTAVHSFRMHCHLNGNVLRVFEELTMWFENGIKTNHCPKTTTVGTSGKPA